MANTPARAGGWRSVLPYALALVLAVVLVVVTSTQRSSSTAAEDVLGDKQLKIMAPAAPGGGWDQTAREMQASLQSLVGRTEVYNVDGAGGTIGLSQFSQLDSQPNQLMVTGLIMVGAIAANNASVDLTAVQPLARLTTDSQVIVVPKDSELKTVKDLAAAMRADLSKVSIAGGSAGGAEQILAGLMAKDLGEDPAKVNYIAHSGGGEAVATLLSGSATAGISGISEIKPQIDAGALRPLAVSSKERVDLLPDVPTLIESGIDVELTNWRGVVAPRGITKAQEKALEDLLVKMTKTKRWRAALKREGWGDVTLAGPEFETFVTSESKRIGAIIDDLGLGGS
jgi:putative tricarboxylic transport membrane protein